MTAGSDASTAGGPTTSSAETAASGATTNPTDADTSAAVDAAALPASEPLAAAKRRRGSAVEAALSALREEVAELRRELSARAADARPPEPPGASDGGLRRTAELLAAALADVPRAEQFQPLADHLYEFVRQAPSLVESLGALPQAIAPLEDGARALDEISLALQASCERFSESLLRLPRAEDYEPLVEPLREFARVAPTLAERLGALMRSVGPLGEAVETLRETVARLERDLPALERGLPAAAGHAALRSAAERMEEAEAAIREALASLPRDPAYARVAGQLRELASVSPSLTEWLHEVPRLAMPLGGSIAALEKAAGALAQGTAEARRAVAHAMTEAAQASPGRAEAPPRRS